MVRLQGRRVVAGQAVPELRPADRRSRCRPGHPRRRQDQEGHDRVRIAAAFAAIVVTGAACGAQVTTSTPTPIRTAPVIRTAAPTPLCQAAPDQPSTKATIALDKGGTIVIQLRPD